MKKYLPYVLALIFCVTFAFTYSKHFSRDNSVSNASSELVSGYNVLRLFLESEQHLKLLRRVKLVLAFQSVDTTTEQLIDDISDTSSQSLAELHALLQQKPAITLLPLSNDTIGKSTFDSLRSTTVSGLVLETDHFERDLLISQTQVLKVISHVALQLSELETSQKRRAWLNTLSKKYDEYSLRIYERLVLA